MNKSNWVDYHCKVKYTENNIHFLALIDTESLGIVGSCTTSIPTFPAIINMLKMSLSKHPTPKSIYVTKEWIRELRPYFPNVQFKDVAVFPKDRKQTTDGFFTSFVEETILVKHTAIPFRQNYE